MNHTHKYVRAILGKEYTIFKCAIAGCSHYLPRSLAVGKKSVCWRCGNEMILNMKNTTLKKPHCYECTKEKIA